MNWKRSRVVCLMNALVLAGDLAEKIERQSEASNNDCA